ncbi:MAG: flagellar hook-basal body protein [Provencibacterium sp.]|jgi:flagellar basal-body rod protein FlgG|nr:flagellar hook-basal body protein [Provencibacterium sp.]
MNIAFYSGVSGLVAYQQDMDTIAHNMANVNTVGYKPLRTEFSDLLYTRMAINNEEEKLVGHGVRASKVELLYGQGNLQSTEYPLDFALVGEGFFAVDRGRGTLEYTRNGAFDLSVEGKKTYLVTADGGYVLDGKGKPIEVKRATDGTYDYGDVQDRLGVYRFDNPYGLEVTTGSSFRETDVSGRAEAVQVGRGEESPYRIVSGAVESSGVNLGQQMVDVIMTQKAYQFNAKIVQTADELEEIVNNLR